MNRALRRLAAGLALAGALAGGNAAAFDASYQPIEVTATPIETFKSGSPERKFGTLEFRGGLELSASDKRFGSLSGLDIAPDGALTAIADTGYWFAAKLIEADGKPVGLENARLASILDSNGNKLIGKGAFDAEGLRIVRRNGEQEALVSFERANVVRRYVPSPDYAHAVARPVKVPLAVGKANRNEGIEAIAVAPEAGPLAGAIVLVAEATLDQAGNIRGWIVDGPRAGAFTVVRRDEFAVTDAAFLPGGDLLILERRFNFSTGVTMRIRRIAVADLKPGATVDGPIQIEANLLYQIDNMEGLSVRAGADGEAILDIVSDDNQNRMLQRTLLLQFALPAGQPIASPQPAPATQEPAPPIPRPRPRAAR